LHIIGVWASFLWTMSPMKSWTSWKEALTTRIANTLEDRWYPAQGREKRNSVVLSLAERAYRARAEKVRNQYTREELLPTRVSAFVVSVGGLVAGGCGKTPVALMLAERFQARGRRVAYLSHGYRGTRTRRDVVMLVAANPNAVPDLVHKVGDEAMLAARFLPGVPVLASRNRAKAALEAMRLVHPEVLIVDDGMQHPALARDLDVLVIDSEFPIGNGRLLPAGPLREPPEQALARADLVIVHGRGPVKELCGRRAQVRTVLVPTRLEPIFRVSRHAPASSSDSSSSAAAAAVAVDSVSLPVFSITECVGKRVFVVAGIARSSRFLATVKEVGMDVLGAMRIADHHVISPEMVAERATALGATLIVTTQKDAVRMPRAETSSSAIPVYALATRCEVLDGVAMLETALATVAPR